MEALCLGELLVDFVSPVVGRSLAEAEIFHKAPGGAPANVAVALARLGVPTGFIGCVGQDPFGWQLAATLAAEGVELKGLRRHPEVRTTLAFVATHADGHKDIAFWRHPGADGELTVADLPASLDTCRVFHFGSVSLSREPARSATIAAARRARAGGAMISFDPNWRAPLWPSAAEGRALIRAALPLADVVKVADEELDLVCGTTDPQRGLALLLEAGPALAVITRGAAGALARSGAATVEVAGHPVAVVDPLGAGDAFVGGLLAGLLELGRAELDETELGRALAFANAAGALATTAVGAIPAMPSRAAVEAFLAEA